MAVVALPQNPPTVLPQTATLERAQIWNPAVVLNIYNTHSDDKFTCPSYNHEGERCSNTATPEKTNKAVELVERLAFSNPMEPSIVQELRQIALLVLCNHGHRDKPEKCDEVVDQWMNSIRVAVMNMCRNYQSAAERVLLKPYVQPHPDSRSPTLENVLNLLGGSRTGPMLQAQEDLIDVLGRRIAFWRTEEDYRRLLGELKKRDEQVAHLRWDLEEQKEAFAKQRREWQIGSVHDLRRTNGDASQARQRYDILDAETTPRRLDGAHNQELGEGINSQEAVTERRQEERITQGSPIDDLQREKETKQQLRDHLARQNRDHEQELQRMQQRADWAQEREQLLREHCSRLQLDLRQAQQELRRQFRDANDEVAPPELPPAPPVGRFRRRIARLLLE
ncbi:MAG: hypothetical protein M1822_006157 [Bathelium mastoideum]|nr:MAG: hypothetical protein M1822_006157 [Bathelium mastoideum]